VSELVVVRHADTAWTVTGQHTGLSDIPLNEAGRANAAKLVPRLAPWSFAAVWCSPLLRAVETCEITGYADRARQNPELVEWNYGEYDGLTTEQIQERQPGWNLWRDGCPGGEDAAAAGVRADAVLESLPAGDDNVLIFSHGHFLRVLCARWLGLAAEQGALFALAPGAIGVLGHEHSQRVLSSLG
jgi:broad specificity phosphatase PhoE